MKISELITAGGNWLATATRAAEGSSLHRGLVRNQMAYDQATEAALDELKALESVAEAAGKYAETGFEFDRKKLLQAVEALNACRITQRPAMTAAEHNAFPKGRW